MTGPHSSLPGSQLAVAGRTRGAAPLPRGAQFALAPKALRTPGSVKPLLPGTELRIYFILKLSFVNPSGKRVFLYRVLTAGSRNLEWNGLELSASPFQSFLERSPEQGEVVEAADLHPNCSRGTVHACGRWFFPLYSRAELSTHILFLIKSTRV